MLFLLLSLTFSFGYLVVIWLAPSISVIEKIGLGPLMGFGLISIIMFLFDLVHIPITYLSILSANSLGIGILVFKNCNYFLDGIKSFQPKKMRFTLGEINFSWLFFAGVLVYLVYGITIKGMFWPIMENDSVIGYDFMAKLIANEGKIKNSIFDNIEGTLAINRFLYPPLVACSFSLAYLSGAMLSKSITLLIFISFLIAFYGLVKKYTTHSAAIIFTCFMAATPEMFSHAALGLTNLPNAAYVGTAIISFFIYIDKNEKQYFYLSTALMVFALFSRTDSIVFAFAVLTWLAYEFWKSKKIKPLLTYATFTIGIFLCWNFYVKYALKADASDFFIKKLFWDPEKLGQILDKAYDFIVADTQLYGLTFWAMFLMLVINFKRLRQDKTSLLAISLISWMLYTFLYYQMDYVLASLDAYMRASYKRGMFCFVPMAWYYVATNKASVWLFNKINNLLYQ